MPQPIDFSSIGHYRKDRTASFETSLGDQEENDDEPQQEDARGLLQNITVRPTGKRHET